MRLVSFDVNLLLKWALVNFKDGFSRQNDGECRQSLQKQAAYLYYLSKTCVWCINVKLLDMVSQVHCPFRTRNIT